jgi:hypothetical protein
MPDISRLVIEVDSSGFLKAEGNGKVFESLLNKIQGTATKTEKSVKGLGDNFAAFSLITNKLPGPLKSIASGMMGMVSPTTAAAGAIIELITAMGRFASEGYTAFQEQETQIARLGAVLQSTGANAWTTSGQLQDLSVSLQIATGRSSDEIMQMQSVLLGFTSITGERFERLTRDMINMAAVMGGSLVGSANAFGKALDTPAESISALTRYGFKFTIEQKNMIKAFEDAGRHAEAQAVILESMEQAFGDAAVAINEAKKETNDYATALVNFKKSAGRVVEPVVNALKSAGTSVLNWYSEGLNGIMDHFAIMSRISNDDYEREDGVRTLAGALQFAQDQLYATRLEAAKLRDEWALVEAGLLKLSDKGLQKLKGDLYNVNQDLGIFESAIKNITEEQKRAADELANDPLKSIKDLYANLGEDYKKTEEGGQKEIERIIALYKRMKTELGDVSEYEIHMIDEIIKMYEEKLKTSRSRIKTELADWQKLLKQALKVEDVSTQFNAVFEFSNRISREFAAIKPLTDILGLDSLDAYESILSQIESALRELLSSGLYDENNQVIQRLIQLRELYNGFIQSSRDTKYMDDLYKELEYSRMTTAERQRQLDIEKGISEEVAKRGQNLRNTLNQIDYLINLKEKTNYDLLMDKDQQRIYDIIGDIGLEVDDKSTLSYVVRWLDELDKIIPGVNKEFGDLYKTMTDGAMIENIEKFEKLTEVFEENGLKIEDLQLLLSNLKSPEDIDLVDSLLDIFRIVKTNEHTAKLKKYQEYIDSLQKQLTLEEQLSNGEITREEYAIQRLAAEQDISYEHAKQAYELQKQIDAYVEFNAAIDGIRQTLANAGLEGFVSTLQDLGAALATGADAGDALGQSFRKVVQGILNMLPSQFISAGLQAIIMGNWPLGLGLIAAGGGMALLGGTMGAGSDMEQRLEEEREREIELLERLNEQYASLMESIQKQEEYYLKKRRELNADWAIDSLGVNDMILTPHGNFSTSPQDTIIAMKHPETLTSGRGNNVCVIVNNYANNTNVEREERISADGTKEILINIKNYIAQNIANGSMDGAFNARDRRNKGIKVSG